jgi:hypothetical protein
MIIYINIFFYKEDIVSKYNHIKSIPIENIPKDEIRIAIKEWAEGDESMEQFLLACYENGIETNGCHAGARPYVGFNYKKDTTNLSGILDETIKENESQIRFCVDGGNPFSGPDWYKSSITIGIDTEYKDEANKYFDKLTTIIKTNQYNEDWNLLFNLIDFFLEKESGLSFRIIHKQNNEYIFSIESSPICEERYKYYNDLFTSLGMNESKEKILQESKRRIWEINSNNLNEIQEKIKVISKEIIYKYNLKPEEKEENMISFITLARYKRKILSEEEFEKWLQQERKKIFA